LYDLIPKVGMKFDKGNVTYTFYSSCAYRVGFNVRSWDRFDSYRILRKTSYELMVVRI